MTHMKSKYLLLTVFMFLASCERPTLSLTETTADQILQSIEVHSGREAVLINFWATWCQPCVEEFPLIVALDKEYFSQGLKTYFISVDFTDSRNQVQTFLELQGVTGLSFLKTDGNDNDFINTIHPKWTGAVPFTLVFSKSEGEVIDYWEGAEKEIRFRTAIEKALIN